jgi:hypothetical protein
MSPFSFHNNFGLVESNESNESNEPNESNESNESNEPDEPNEPKDVILLSLVTYVGPHVKCKRVYLVELVEVAVDDGVLGQAVLLPRGDDDVLGHFLAGGGLIVDLRRGHAVLHDDTVHRHLALAGGYHRLDGRSRRQLRDLHRYLDRLVLRLAFGYDHLLNLLDQGVLDHGRQIGGVYHGHVVGELIAFVQLVS